MPLDVALLWHMHQPCYHDAATGEAILPWVRLHATKAYFDMAEAMARAPANVRCTVNFVPVLLDQLAGYANGTVRDTFLVLSAKPTAQLDVEEVKFVLRWFFMANWETMVKPHPRYWALLLKRGMDRASWDLDQLAKRFTIEELRDLQVWFNLAWFGWAAKAKFPVVAEMIAKGSKFTEDDKTAVLKAQMDCMQAVVPAWRTLYEQGKVEITATPFYHPILPLLVNTRHAQRAVPDIALPDDFIAPDDALAQVERAAAFHEKTWGRRPVGMWPAEGSVSPEVIPLFRKAGVEWIATDEDILFASLGRRHRDADLYRPWIAKAGGEEIAMFFRDRVLSDLVGFTYSKMGPQEAADEFVGRLKHIAATAHGERPCVSVILDGENPWEYYPDGGEGFLTRLYATLGSSHEIQPVTFGGKLQHIRERGVRIDALPGLHSGSWISANYRIWIGHHEDNAGWNLLKRAREDIRRRIGGPHPPEAAMADKAMDSLFRAEGSDWFWWFGDDFSSDNDVQFDQLFRNHIANAYRFAGLEPPSAVSQPIAKAALGVSQTSRPPVCFIAPKIDGHADSYFEWKGAGYYAVGKSEGTMHKGTAYLVGVHYGFDLQTLYLRLDPVTRLTAMVSPVEDLRIVLVLMVTPAPGAEPLEYRVMFPMRPGVGSFVLVGPRASESQPGLQATLRECKAIAYEKVVELSMPMADLRLAPGGHLDFSLRVMLNEVEVDRYPRNGAVRAEAPTADFERVNWWV